MEPMKAPMGGKEAKLVTKKENLFLFIYMGGVCGEWFLRFERKRAMVAAVGCGSYSGTIFPA